MLSCKILALACLWSVQYHKNYLPHTEGKLPRISVFNVSHCKGRRPLLDQERHQVGSVAIDHDQNKKRPADKEEMTSESARSGPAASREKKQRYKERCNAVLRGAVAVEVTAI